MRTSATAAGSARAAVSARDEAAPELPVDIVTVGIGGSATREGFFPSVKSWNATRNAPANWRGPHVCVHTQGIKTENEINSYTNIIL
jgi:hypothetical protein